MPPPAARERCPGRRPKAHFVNGKHVDAWTGAVFVKNIKSTPNQSYAPLLSRHTAIPHRHTRSYIVQRRASAAPSPHKLIPEPALSNLSEEEQMNSPKTGPQKVYTLSSASQSPPPERGAPLQGQPRPKMSSIDNQALHPVELLRRDHRVEPREKLLALRLIIERARMLVLCAVRCAENRSGQPARRRRC